MDSIITRNNIDEAADAIRDRAPDFVPQVALVLGSGLSSVVEAMNDVVAIDYADVAHMALSTVEGHVGRFVLGNLCDTPVACMQGRLHSYEGYEADQIAFPIYVLHALGARELIVTNAAGGIDASYGIGDLMLIEDHINYLVMNPCRGCERPDVNPRFFDMTQAYDPHLRNQAQRAAKACGIVLHSGVYIATIGPSFETPAEIRAFRSWGADAVGMSTVLEVIAARSLNMRTLGISMISNPAAGVNPQPLDMDDVARAAAIAASNVTKLLVQLFTDRRAV